MLHNGSSPQPTCGVCYKCLSEGPLNIWEVRDGMWSKEPLPKPTACSHTLFSFRNLFPTFGFTSDQTVGPIT